MSMYHSITFTRVLCYQWQRGNPKELSTRWVQGCPPTNEIISDGENGVQSKCSAR